VLALVRDALAMRALDLSGDAILQQVEMRRLDPYAAADRILATLANESAAA
jgi:LAO/AO transport system kinase